MDPDAILAELREMVADINCDNHHSSTTRRLAEKIEDLDEWIVRGGHLPKDWDAMLIGAGLHTPEVR